MSADHTPETLAAAAMKALENVYEGFDADMDEYEFVHAIAFLRFLRGMTNLSSRETATVDGAVNILMRKRKLAAV